MLLSFTDEICSSAVESEYESGFSLYYKLIRTADPSPCADPRLSDVYSVLIIMLGDDGAAETSFIYDVTRCGHTAKALIKLLRDNAVTPCTAEYVIEDLI